MGSEELKEIGEYAISTVEIDAVAFALEVGGNKIAILLGQSVTGNRATFAFSKEIAQTIIDGLTDRLKKMEEAIQ